ncbi:MAG: energy-coupling factor transporter transmembrane protein EcfT [Clostridia bacterium]|nr:energy-coupling factor transporter transmembrane protein EcfT [Clostridia bacterium]
MISDITLGQFFPGESHLHKADPRTKIVGSIVYMAAIFCAKNVFAYLFMILFTAMLAMVGHIRIRLLWKSIKPLFFVLLIMSMINLFATKGTGEPLLSFWKITIYEEGIWRAVLVSVVRVVLLVMGSSLLLTYTTSPIQLTDGIETLLSPLKKIHVPVHEFAMMMTIALRFIPTLIEETDKIMKAQKARGADFSSGGLIKRAKALLPVLIPLFVSSFQHAMDLATAMECRCYHGGEGRTKYRILKFTGVDVWIGLALLVALAAVIVINKFLPIGNVM